MSDNYDKAAEIKDLLNEYKKFTKKYESIIEDGSEIVKRLNDIGEGNLAIRMKSYLIQRMQSFINGFEMFQISEVNEALKELIEEEEGRIMYKKEICPICGEGKELDALSRKDDETMICSECGTKEALEDFFNNMVKE